IIIQGTGLWAQGKVAAGVQLPLDQRSGGQAECVRGLRLDGRVAEGQREGFAVVPVPPLVAIVGAQRVFGLAHDNVFCRGVGAGPVDGEALRWAKGAARLLDGGDVSGLWLGAGS